MTFRKISVEVHTERGFQYVIYTGWFVRIKNFIEKIEFEFFSSQINPAGHQLMAEDQREYLVIPSGN